MAAPFKVKALFEYSSPHEDDLQFAAGQIITVVEEEDDDWYTGKYVDDAGAKHEGIFPRNFVEKYEPVAPPRPTRTRAKKESEPAAPPPAPPPAELPADAPAPSSKPATEDEEPEPVAHAAPAPPSLPTAPPPEAAPAPAPPVPPVSSTPPPLPKAAEPQATSPPISARPSPGPSKNAPPPPAAKPSGNAFKDRIAAFNKTAAPPPTPFKPSGLAGATGFIKKPFVAPPPSRNAYVPPPREAPTTKVYRRDEDPEIKEREQENLQSAEKAGLVAGSSQSAEGEEEPKPLSLKERMALLQKQQQEQAHRHAEAAAKREKPKRPVKKRIESNDGADEGESQSAPPLERRDSEDTAGRPSVDEPPVGRANRRKSSTKGLGEPNDGNEADLSGAGDTTEGQEDVTEREDSDDKPALPVRVAAPVPAPAAETPEAEGGEEEEEEEEEDEDVDPEVRRKEELRARMAKMSGGMGMAGMFGMPVPSSSAPKKKKASAPTERRSSEAPEAVPSPAFQAPPVPAMMMALPGLSAAQRPEESAPIPEGQSEDPVAENNDDEDGSTPMQALTPAPGSLARAPTGGAPPVPSVRPAPPPVPSEARSPPAPPMSGLKSPSAGSESDDELSEKAQDNLSTPRSEAPPATRAPPPPPPVAAPSSIDPGSPRSPVSRQRTLSGEGMSPTSPTSPSSKRASRVPPPIPTFSPTPPPASTRPPPPPPPGGISRQNTADNNRPLSPTTAFRKEESNGDDEITEYEGDYDTDIASSVPHKDALKSHGRDSSFEETASTTSPPPPPPALPPSLPPPVPSSNAPRAPPPVPSMPPPPLDNKPSTDMPRAAPPPPPPPPPGLEAPKQDADYDPFNYTAARVAPAAPSHPPPPSKSPEPAFSPPEPHAMSPPAMPSTLPPAMPPAMPNFQPPPLQTRAPPPAPPSNRAPPRPSLEVQRSVTNVRRSIDFSRPSMESGFVANDVDLAPQSGWWLQPKGLPPQLQGRKDIFFESEESQSADQGTTMVTRDMYILYQDYSQTVITVTFDPQDTSNAHLGQRHEPPPRALRQDQLEESYERFGRLISTAVTSKKDSVVGDGTPQGLVYELLRPLGDALLPVGTRAYGALVYSNLANASTTLNDEIRPGDIMSVRNAKFQGKHGAMHAKYSVEIGKPDHVAVVAEWDGTKRKVRAWEQGRESKKVKLESFKLDDLRSGEVKIWRVMPRSWVGWEGQN
ncbi:hypothetical protein RB601_002623 [Gaeumannomyces tritici]